MPRKRNEAYEKFIKDLIIGYTNKPKLVRSSNCTSSIHLNLTIKRSQEKNSSDKCKTYRAETNQCTPVYEDRFNNEKNIISSARNSFKCSGYGLKKYAIFNNTLLSKMLTQNMMDTNNKVFIEPQEETNFM